MDGERPGSRYLYNIKWLIADLLRRERGRCGRVFMYGLLAVFFQLTGIGLLWLFLRQIDATDAASTKAGIEPLVLIVGVALAMLADDLFKYRYNLAGYRLWNAYTKYCSRRALSAISLLPLPGKPELNRYARGREFGLMTTKYPLSMGISARLLVGSSVDLLQLVVYGAIFAYVSYVAVASILSICLLFLVLLYRQNLHSARHSREAENRAGDAMREKVAWLKKHYGQERNEDAAAVELASMFERSASALFTDALVESFASIKKGELYLGMLVSFSLSAVLAIVSYQAYQGSLSLTMLLITVLLAKNALGVGRSLGTAITSINRHYPQISRYIRFMIRLEECRDRDESAMQGGETVLQAADGSQATLRPGEPLVLIGSRSEVGRFMLFPLYNAVERCSGLPPAGEALFCPSARELDSVQKIRGHFPFADDVPREEWRKVAVAYGLDLEALPLADPVEIMRSKEAGVAPAAAVSTALCLATLSDRAMVVVDGRFWNHVTKRRKRIFQEMNRNKFLFYYYHFRWPMLKHLKGQACLLLADGEAVRFTDSDWIERHFEELEEIVAGKEERRDEKEFLQE